MKKIFVTRKLLKSNEKRMSEIWDAKLNPEDKIYFSIPNFGHSFFIRLQQFSCYKNFFHKFSKIFGLGPPVYQSIISTVCKIGILVP